MAGFGAGEGGGVTHGSGCIAHPVCDFCRHYDFNERHPSQGWCRLHKRVEDPTGGCECFECDLCDGDEAA